MVQSSRAAAGGAGLVTFAKPLGGSAGNYTLAGGSQNQQAENVSPNCLKARKWLAEHFGPYICVFSSKVAKTRLSQHNGALSPAEFLRPFGEVGNLRGYSVKTSEKNQAYKLSNFRVNFIDSEAMWDNLRQTDGIPKRILEEMNPRDAKNVKNFNSEQHYLQGQKEETRSTFKTKQEATNDFLNLIENSRQKTEEKQTPWFSLIKKQYLQANRFQQHELTQQPIAFIYFLSVEEKDPLASIDLLRTVEQLPRQYRTGVYDNSPQNIRSFVFILNHTGNESIFQQQKAKISSQFNEKLIFQVNMSVKTSQIGTSGELTSADFKPPIPRDLWSSYLELDLRKFEPSEEIPGQMFTQNDRTIAQQAVYKIVEQLLMVSTQKIQTIETNISKTRKGFKGMLRIFKQSERGENDGLASNFRMSRSEIELRTLIDLAFTIQDYETTYANAQYPSSDFKGIKAFVHAAHCDELKLYARIAHDKFYAQTQMKDLVYQANLISDAYSRYSHPNLIRFSFMMAELFQLFGENREAANFYTRIGNLLNDKTMLKAMCFEQAAFEYLMLQQFHKFAYYMSLAGQSFERVNLKGYAFHCFQLVHPLYQSQLGWNQIQGKLYSSLGLNAVQAGQMQSDLPVVFFRNMLKLTLQFDEINKQKNCLQTSLQAYTKYRQDQTSKTQAKDHHPNAQNNSASTQKGGSLQSNNNNQIGHLDLPEILPHTFEVFLEHEKLLTNLQTQTVPIVPGGSYCDNQGPCNLIDREYVNFNGHVRNQAQFEEAQKSAAKVAESLQANEDVNQSNIPWRILQKQVTEFVRKQKVATKESSLPDSLYAVSGEEMTECSIHDATCEKERNDVTYKKQRSAFVNRPIRVRFIIRNPLLIDIIIAKLRVKCTYLDEETNKPVTAAEGFQSEEQKFYLQDQSAQADSSSKSSSSTSSQNLFAPKTIVDSGFVVESRDLKLQSKQEVEMILKVTPTKPGKILLQKLQWDLFESFQCEYDLVSSNCNEESETSQEAICLPKEFRYEIPRQLCAKEKMFRLKVLPDSAEMTVKIEFQKNGTMPRNAQSSNLIYSETDSGTIRICNKSSTLSIRNVFVLCSHPIIFDFDIKRVLNESGEPIVLKPEEEIQVPVHFRAAVKGESSVKFLFRYEVFEAGKETESLENPSKKTANATSKFRFLRYQMFLNSNFAFDMQAVVHMSVREPNNFLVNLKTKQKMTASWYENPQISSIEAVEGAQKWTLEKKDALGNFFIVKPRKQVENQDLLDKEDLQAAQLAYMRESQFVGDLLEGLDSEPTLDENSLMKDKIAYRFMCTEKDYLKSIKAGSFSDKRKALVGESETIDLVVRWRITKQRKFEKMEKKGFFTIFGVQLTREKRTLTYSVDQILEINERISQNPSGSDHSAIASQLSRVTDKQKMFADKKVKPIRVTFEYPQTVQHPFSSSIIANGQQDQQKTKVVTLVLNIQNLLQTDSCTFDCELVAHQAWRRDPSSILRREGQGYPLVDVSEGESFLWLGKTTFLLRQMKPNETKKIVLRASIARPGIYDLNRFSINIKQTKPIIQMPHKENQHILINKDSLASPFKIKDQLIVEAFDAACDNLQEISPTKNQSTLDDLLAN